MQCVISVGKLRAFEKRRQMGRRQRADQTERFVPVENRRKGSVTEIRARSFRREDRAQVHMRCERFVCVRFVYL